MASASPPRSPTKSNGQVEAEPTSPPTSPARVLPPDLPTSLDDRKTFDTYYPGQQEFYDDWAGSASHISQPKPRSPHPNHLALRRPSAAPVLCFRCLAPDHKFREFRDPVRCRR